MTYFCSSQVDRGCEKLTTQHRSTPLWIWAEMGLKLLWQYLLFHNINFTLQVYCLRDDINFILKITNSWTLKPFFLWISVVVKTVQNTFYNHLGKFTKTWFYKVELTAAWKVAFKARPEVEFKVKTMASYFAPIACTLLVM